MRDPKETRYYSKEKEDSPGHTQVFVKEAGIESELDKRLDLRRHSPSGFSWGYRGSGTTQLALAILADYASDDWALEHYRDFAKHVVAENSGEAPFFVSGRQIEQAVGAPEE